MVESETRIPDPRYTGGFRRRRFVADTRIAVANSLWDVTPFVVSFWDDAASVYLELETDGALAGHEADTFRMFDRPGLQLLNLGSATAADAYLAWAGWFELYTTERLTASAWVDYYEKPESSEWGVNWVRHLDLVEAPMPRADIEFPDFSGRPSVKWRAARSGADSARPVWLPEAIEIAGQWIEIAWTASDGTGVDLRLELHATLDLFPWKSVTLETPNGQQIGAELRADANNLSAVDAYPVADIPASAALVFRRLTALFLPVEEQRIVIPTPADLPGATISFTW
jgi:hypothetical protein